MKKCKLVAAQRGLLPAAFFAACLLGGIIGVHTNLCAWNFADSHSGNGGTTVFRRDYPVMANEMPASNSGSSTTTPTATPTAAASSTPLPTPLAGNDEQSKAANDKQPVKEEQPKPIKEQPQHLLPADDPPAPRLTPAESAARGPFNADVPSMDIIVTWLNSSDPRWLAVANP